MTEPNAELRAIYEADQADRFGAFRHGIGDRDEVRLQDVLALIDAGEVRCADAYFHAAIVLHHSPIVVSDERRCRRHYLRAHELAKRAAELGHARGDWLAAASYDRWLVTQEEVDPDALLAAVIEPVSENPPGDDADVIELRRDGSLVDEPGQ